MEPELHNTLDVNIPGEQLADSISFTVGGIPLEGERFGPDSLIVRGFLPNRGISPQAFLAALSAEARWMPRSSRFVRYRGRELKRTKFGVCTSDKGVNALGQLRTIRKYGYTGAQWELLLQYRQLASMPELNRLVEYFNRDLRITADGVPLDCTFNHAIGTRYETGEDNIGPHNDKVRDIAENSPIVMLSLGGKRELHFALGTEADKHWKPTNVTPFIMEAGTLVILGPKTNQMYKHWVPRVRDEMLIDRRVDHLVEERVSLVLRNIATVVPLHRVKRLTRRKLQKKGEPIPEEYKDRPDDRL